MVEYIFGEKLAHEVERRWRMSCKDDTAVIHGVIAEQGVLGLLIETDHWHRTEPHHRYWRLTLKGENIVEDKCTETPDLWKSDSSDDS